MTSSLFAVMRRGWRPALDALLTVSLIGLACTLIWLLLRSSGAPVQRVAVRPSPSRTAKALPALPSEPVSIDGALLKGSRTANLVVIEYSDVQCPYCGRFVSDTLPGLETQFVKTGKVLFAFRHFPLDQLHPMARPAAEAIECANQQGQGWPMHDHLFENPKQLDGQMILAKAMVLGLKKELFSSCMDGANVKARVAADVASGQALGVTGTPTFFIGTSQTNGRVKLVERVPGAVPLAAWQASLKKWLPAGVK